MAGIVHDLDYRPVTNGVHGYGWGRWQNEEAAVNDIYGYNYMKEEGFAKERNLNPDVLAVVTEHETAQSYLSGQVFAEKVVITADSPAKIRVETRRTTMKANGQDLIYVECTILDKEGNEVPTADNTLEFSLEGSAKITGEGNGDNMGLEPFKASKHSAFNGKCLAILQSTREAGSITCTVSSQGLESTVIVLTSE